MPHSCARLPSPFPVFGQRSSRTPRPLHRHSSCGHPALPWGFASQGWQEVTQVPGPVSQPSSAHRRAVRKRRRISASPDAGRSAPNTLQRPVGRTAPFRPACSREQRPGWVAFSTAREYKLCSALVGKAFSFLLHSFLC